MAKKKLVMTETARRILHTRKKLKLTQTDVAEYCGVDRVSVSGWERGSMPKADNFQKLTELFKVDANWLLSGENSGAIESHQNEKQLENFKSSNPPRFLQINLYHEESSLAGSYNLPLSALSKEQIPHSHISCFELQSNNLEPVMPSGTIVAVDLRSQKIRDGDIYVINHKGMIRATRVYKIPGHALRLKSFNSDYPEEIIKNTDTEELHIIGRVFWSCSYR